MKLGLIRLGFLLFPFFVTLAGAQGRPITLDTVRVSITRDSARSPLLVPFAVSVLRPDSSRPGQRHSALDESLLLLPGVFAANRQNPTQDPRISIRGFGARSAFGVRGVRILWDGIPLTLADGQTPVDYVDLDAIDRIEVIRGSAAALYGNSSGGVVNLGTALPTDSSFGVRVRQSREEGAMSRVSAQVNGRRNAFAFRAGVSHASGEGFRDFSRLRATRASARATGTVFGNNLSLHLSALSSPLAQNPGSITEAQMRADPRIADPLSVRRKAGKTVEQRQVGIGVDRRIADLGVSVLVYGGTRGLHNPLTFATVTLDRTSGGATFRAELPARLKNLRASFAAGIDLQYQNDDRHEFENCVDDPAPAVSARCPVKGSEMGALRRNQREIVTSAGPYAKAELDLNKRTILTLAARGDVVSFRVVDRMPAAIALNQSGKRKMRAFSPMIGIVYRLGDLASIYTSASSAFETPTATELANKPDGSTGLNPIILPQNSRTLEMGIKGFLGSGIGYDAATFSTRVSDELIPFEIPGGAGRRFFRNAGRTQRNGLELAISRSTGQMDVAVTHTRSLFAFEDYAVASQIHTGKRIPGLPVSRTEAAFTYRRQSLFSTTEAIFSSSAFVDDANTSRAAGYELLNWRAGGHFGTARFSVSPAIGIQNVFGRSYSNSINVNAAGGKYFEPAAGRVVYGLIQFEARR